MIKKIYISLLLAFTFHGVQVMAQSSSIAWDTASMRLLSPNRINTYSGYARMIQLNDNSLFAVFGNSDSGIMGTRSYDNGSTWSKPISILPTTVSHTMDNAEITQLHDGSLIISTNLRPIGALQNKDTSRHFQIGVIRSTDLGIHWSPLRILYTASWSYADACWEPKVIQLPSGKVELYFSDESPYTMNADQNISMLSAHEHGENWTTTPRIVSYRIHHRDGMPVPILLSGDSVIAMAIEDNGYGCGLQFRISIIRDNITDDWSEYVTAESPHREYALTDFARPDDDNIYAGAPYLVQMPDGTTILSFQSRKGGGEGARNCFPTVMIGDKDARNFHSPSTPFMMAEGKAGLWNSLCALNNGEVILLTTTNAYSSNGRDQIWMIKGKVSDR
jgi:hypothetical protein